MLRWAWRAARAVRAVRRTQEFSRSMVRAVNDVKDQIESDTGRSVETMSDTELTDQMARRLSFEGQQRQPVPRDFREGPDRTTERHVRQGFE